METINKINQRLKDNYGADLDGNPHYRVVWSDTQLEIRRGYFPIGNTGLINAEKETKEVKKYPFIKSRWVLEKKCYLPAIGELPVSEMRGYSYEAIFTFESAQGQFLLPVWRAVEILVRASIDGPEQVFTSHTEDAEKQKEMEKDIQYFENVLEEESPYIPTMLHNKEAVKLDSTKVFTGENNAD
jgi:hypothetical protein